MLQQLRKFLMWPSKDKLEESEKRKTEDKKEEEEQCLPVLYPGFDWNLSWGNLRELYWYEEILLAQRTASFRFVHPETLQVNPGHAIFFSADMMSILLSYLSSPGKLMPLDIFPRSHTLTLREIHQCIVSVSCCEICNETLHQVLDCGLQFAENKKADYLNYVFVWEYNDQKRLAYPGLYSLLRHGQNSETFERIIKAFKTAVFLRVSTFSHHTYWYPRSSPNAPVQWTNDLEEESSDYTYREILCQGMCQDLASWSQEIAAGFKRQYLFLLFFDDGRLCSSEETSFQTKLDAAKFSSHPQILSFLHPDLINCLHKSGYCLLAAYETALSYCSFDGTKAKKRALQILTSPIFWLFRSFGGKVQIISEKPNLIQFSVNKETKETKELKIEIRLEQKILRERNTTSKTRDIFYTFINQETKEEHEVNYFRIVQFYAYYFLSCPCRTKILGKKRISNDLLPNLSLRNPIEGLLKPEIWKHNFSTSPFLPLVQVQVET